MEKEEEKEEKKKGKGLEGEKGKHNKLTNTYTFNLHTNPSNFPSHLYFPLHYPLLLLLLLLLLLQPLPLLLQHFIFFPFFPLLASLLPLPPSRLAALFHFSSHQLPTLLILFSDGHKETCGRERESSPLMLHSPLRKLGILLFPAEEEEEEVEEDALRFVGRRKGG